MGTGQGGSQQPPNGLSGARGVCPSTHAGRLTAGSLPVLGLWVPRGQAGAQPSSSALALLVLSSRGDCCPFPGRTVAHVVPRVSSHPGDDPDSKAFPSPAGAGSGPAPSQEVPEPVPGPSLARPRQQHRGRTRAWGQALDPGKRSESLPAWPWGLTAPEAQCAKGPGMLLERLVRASRQPPCAPGCQPGFAAVIAQGAASHSGEGNIYKQQPGGAHRPVWERRLKGE